MAEKEHLYLLWINGDPVTAAKGVFMSCVNSLRRGGGKRPGMGLPAALGEGI
jgi:hypothetical protein